MYKFREIDLGWRDGKREMNNGIAYLRTKWKASQSTIYMTKDSQI